MRASGYDRVESDWYIEPAWIVDALAEVEAFRGHCWDPCCGAGNIPLTLRKRGVSCWGSDRVDRGFGTTNLDFFLSSDQADNIISNPPYGVIERFIEKALSVTTSKVAVLARLALLEGQKRQHLLRSTPLARVWVSSRRVSMPPGGTDIKASGGSIAYAWFVFEHGHQGKPTLDWI